MKEKQPTGTIIQEKINNNNKVKDKAVGLFRSLFRLSKKKDKIKEKQQFNSSQRSAQPSSPLQSELTLQSNNDIGLITNQVDDNTYLVDMSKRDDIVNGKDNSTATVCSIKNKTHNKKEQKEYDQDVTVTVLNDHSLYDTQERKSNKKVDEIIVTSYSNKNHIHTIYDNHDSVAKHCNSGYDHSQSYNHSHNCSAKHSHNSHNHQSLSSYDNHNHGGSKSYDTHNHGGSTSYGYGGSTSYDYGGSSSYDNGGSSSYDNY